MDPYRSDPDTQLLAENERLREKHRKATEKIRELKQNDSPPSWPFAIASAVMTIIAAHTLYMLYQSRVQAANLALQLTEVRAQLAHKTEMLCTEGALFDGETPVAGVKPVNNTYTFDRDLCLRHVTVFRGVTIDMHGHSLWLEDVDLTFAGVGMPAWPSTVGIRESPPPFDHYFNYFLDSEALKTDEARAQTKWRWHGSDFVTRDHFTR